MTSVVLRKNLTGARRTPVEVILVM